MNNNNFKVFIEDIYSHLTNDDNIEIIQIYFGKLFDYFQSNQKDIDYLKSILNILCNETDYNYNNNTINYILTQINFMDGEIYNKESENLDNSNVINTGFLNDTIEKSINKNIQPLNNSITNIYEKILNLNIDSSKLTSIQDKINILERVLDSQMSVNNSIIESFKSITINTKTSKELGIIGEEQIYNMIIEVNNKLNVKIVSSTSHCGDINVIDEKLGIYYIIEVKNKQSIDQNDINKFISDVESNNNNLYKIFGIFMSINTINIPKKGSIYIDGNMIYLTSKYINKEVINILFNLLIPSLLNIQKTKNNITTFRYEFDEEKLNMILNVKKQYTDIKNIYNFINEEININSKSRENLIKIRDLIYQHLLKLEEIHSSFKLDENSISSERELCLNELRKHILKNKKVTKKELLTTYPLIQDIIQSKTLEELKLI